MTNIDRAREHAQKRPGITTAQAIAAGIPAQIVRTQDRRIRVHCWGEADPARVALGDEPAVIAAAKSERDERRADAFGCCGAA